MSNVILIGKLIYSALSQDTNVSTQVGTSIFPIVAEAETKYPFIVYSKTNCYSSSLTKDGYLGDKATFQVNVVSDNYDDSCGIANNVRNVFENCEISNSYLMITNVHMTSIMETYNENAFIQTMTFECDAE